MVLVLIILFFGLRPKTWPNINNIQWPTDTKGLVFYNPAFAYVDNLKSFHTTPVKNEFSIRLLVATANLQKPGFRPIVMLHSGNDQDLLTISQWEASIIVMNGDDYTYRRKLPRISAKDILVADTPICLTVISGSEGTRLYSDGTLIQENKDLILKIPDDGEKLRLVLGNSVYGNNSWEGIIYSLAMYDSQLSAESIQSDGRSVLDTALHVPDDSDHLQLLYIFDAGKGSMVADLSGNHQPLLLPSRPLALERSFLALPWHDFTLNRNHIFDIIVNLVGFIPFGAVLFMRFRLSSALPARFPARATVLIGFLLSLVIELSQAWLPDRTSSLLDLILNTAGTGLGVMVIKAAGTDAGKIFFKLFQGNTAEK